MVISNNGNAKLRGVSLSTVLSTTAVTDVSGLSSYSCLLNNAGSGLTLPQDLAAGQAFHCTASYDFTSAAQVEAGDLTFTPTVSATSTAAGDMTQADPLIVTVPSLPQIDVHLADTTCAGAVLSAPTIGTTGPHLLARLLTQPAWVPHHIPSLTGASTFQFAFSEGL